MRLNLSINMVGLVAAWSAVVFFHGGTSVSRAAEKEVATVDASLLPFRQGKAKCGLVSHGGKIYSICGFEALNAEGETHDSRSRAEVAVFDPQNGPWTDLTPLPEPRSSFDAAVVGDRVYVVGGSNLRGGGEGEWHETAWSADLTKTPLRWEAMTPPSTKRRAMAFVAHGERFYLIGGMMPEGPTRRVDVFNPADDSWTTGPDLAGEKGIDGFGPAGRSLGENLYVSSLSGSVQRLRVGSNQWEVVAPLDAPRFFHQMVPFRGGLLLVGGANMTEGELLAPEFVPLAQGTSNEAR